MPTELCFKCGEVKQGVTLCADDRLCPECYMKNEIALKAIRDAKAPNNVNTSNSPVLSDKRITRRQPPRTRLATTTAAAAKKDNNSVSSINSPVINNNAPSRLNTVAVSTPPVRNDNSKLFDVIHELNIKVNSQSKTIETLTNKLKFVMSLLGIVDDELTLPETNSNSAAQSSTNPPSDNNDRMISKTQTWSQIVASKPVDVTFSNQEVVKNVSTEYKNSIIAAVYADQQEDARRAHTFIVHGLPVSNTVSDKEQIINLCDNEFGVKLDITFNKRLGKESENGKPRPLLVALRCQDSAQHIVKLARQLRKSQNSNIRDNIYINANLTKAKAKMEYERRLKRRMQSSTTVNNQHNTDNHQPEERTRNTINPETVSLQQHSPSQATLSITPSAANTE